MQYKVILKVKYYDAEFLFDNEEEACVFARQLLLHIIDNDDVEKVKSVNIEVLNTTGKTEA